MGAHETLDGTLDTAIADSTRELARELAAAWNAHQDGTRRMDATEWARWEGDAYFVLSEVARG